MSKTKTTKKTTTPIEFDPNKQYTWQSTDSITFTGAEFEVIYKSLLNFSASSACNVQAIAALLLATNVAQSKLVEYVGNGTFKEAPQAAA